MHYASRITHWIVANALIALFALLGAECANAVPPAPRALDDADCRKACEAAGSIIDAVNGYRARSGRYPTRDDIELPTIKIHRTTCRFELRSSEYGFALRLVYFTGTFGPGPTFDALTYQDGPVTVAMLGRETVYLGDGWTLHVEGYGPRPEPW